MAKHSAEPGTASTVSPRKGFVFRIRAREIFGKSKGDQPPIRKEGDFYVFYCRKVSSGTNRMKAVRPFLPDMLVRDNPSMVVTFRKDMSDIFFSLIDVSADNVAVGSWMEKSEEDAKFEVKHRQDSPYAEEQGAINDLLRNAVQRAASDIKTEPSLASDSKPSGSGTSRKI